MTQALKLAAAMGSGVMSFPYPAGEMFEVNAYTGTGSSSEVFSTGLISPGDLGYGWLIKGRNVADNPTLYEDTAYGATLATNSVGGDGEFNSYVINTFGPDFNVNVSSNTNTSTTNYVLYGFSFAPGFLDVRYDLGTAATKTVNHNLGVVPELIIRKEVTNPSTANWHVRHADLAALSAGNYLVLNTAAAVATATNRFTANPPTSTLFRVGANAEVNGGGKDYVTWLFASAPGVSKVGMYTGDGTIGKTINCGFSTGARFVMTKRADASGAWYIWDKQRGIVAGNDPHFSPNSGAAEVTGNDSIDPTNVGFIVNQVAATNVNVNAAIYIYLAIA